MKKQPWWKITFRETYRTTFDEIYSAKRGEKEVAFLIQSLRLKKGSRILDLACGQGRHAIPLARHGMKVTGVDWSAPLLQLARHRGKIAGTDVLFIKKDMRTYRTAGKYDTVLILGNSFGYFSDRENEQVLSNIAASLKTGGRLVLDLANTPGMLYEGITTKSTQKIKKGSITTRVLNFNPETFQATLRWQFLQNKKKVSFTGTLRLYTPPEINHLLAERNLIVKKTYGSFTKKPYNITTKRYLIVAQKI
ncbi:MAG: hypothetical protein A2840_02045 [Candidatus Buchananbacteria bacterium RIFCSPHIGHO2_01_FULL_47_11b]|uniref:Methyltransferase domain-containing protein n=1 Tax=Candidatus Buchananbacteria bacterium RIFCSPHIGHO2_01_FULL_47_11b TaxID=1797537 RepID=A0A1G1Y7I4_9BACT|nr:MAG: hypothetical protein A2840_02045 [Candidatus Buchananbacteria bacterium RIFCSPHIGHO2_01_FULL_47_11b]HLC69860.1 class I SAM-dependent methyltransferase [Patescibacteria group bacterium]